jgi:ABC-type dipeptide/oligopeptide/nickel transport system permease subunit
VAVSLDPSPGQRGTSPEAGVTSARASIEGRSLGQIAWRRLRRDRVAMAGGIFIGFFAWPYMGRIIRGQVLSLRKRYMVIPGLAIFITVMAFNLFGDGLRDALDPRAR